jgi:hypothetical protein
MLNTVHCHDVSEAASFTSHKDSYVDVLYFYITRSVWGRIQAFYTLGQYD